MRLSEDESVRARDVDLALREDGKGPAFFWGHGLLGSMAQEDAAALLDWRELSREARLLRWDARGHGGSEATLDPAEYRWPELAADLWALVDRVGAERVVLGGLSMGCATALHAAVLAPERIDALVLVAPPTAWRTRARQARVYRWLAAVIERVGLAPFRFVASVGGRGAGGTLAELQRSVLDQLRWADRRAVAAALRGAAASDLPPLTAVESLRAPALVLAWRGDSSHPLSTAEQLAETLPRAELHVAATLEEVRAWSASIREFLAALKPRAPRGGS